MTRLQAQIQSDAKQLCMLLNQAVSDSTIHYAVEDARRALRVLARVADGIRTMDAD